MSAGQVHESRHVARLIDVIRVRPMRRPRGVAGDKGCSYRAVRANLRKRGIRAVIPRRADQPGRRGRPPLFDRAAYRRRNAVERCVGWLKQNRRLPTRYEKLAVNDRAFVRLAMIRRYLHLLFSGRA